MPFTLPLTQRDRGSNVPQIDSRTLTSTPNTLDGRSMLRPYAVSLKWFAWLLAELLACETVSSQHQLVQNARLVR